jgi:hypothetical protein
MAKIYSYRKIIDKWTTHYLREDPIKSDNELQDRTTELCTIDEITYVSVPDSVVLPEQPSEIALSFSEVDMTDTKIVDAIKKASPHIKLIDDRVVDRIRMVYSLTDELKMLRLAASIEANEYHLFVEECRSWGKAEKKKLGL